MAQHTNLYQLAYYYDIAMHRDITDQMDFVCDVFRHHCGKELESLLDIACGPGYHAAEAVRRGIDAVGIDLMPEMLDYAREILDPELDVEWFVADMREFQIPQPVDMAICVFDGVDCLTKNEDMIRHLRSVAANLKEGGLYLLQHTHPRDCSLASYGEYEYSGSRDDTQVRIEWATNKPYFDLVSSVAHVEIALHIRENGTEKVIYDEADERLYSPQELQILTELSAAFDVVAWYGDYKLDQPFDQSPQAQTMLLVLQKKD